MDESWSFCIGTCRDSRLTSRLPLLKYPKVLRWMVSLVSFWGREKRRLCFGISVMRRVGRRRPSRTFSLIQECVMSHRTRTQEKRREWLEATRTAWGNPSYINASELIKLTHSSTYVSSQRDGIRYHYDDRGERVSPSHRDMWYHATELSLMANDLA